MIVIRSLLIVAVTEFEIRSNLVYVPLQTHISPPLINRRQQLDSYLTRLLILI